jgi:hypothetical protein
MQIAVRTPWWLRFSESLVSTVQHSTGQRPLSELDCSNNIAEQVFRGYTVRHCPGSNPSHVLPPVADQASSGRVTTPRLEERWVVPQLGALCFRK